MSNTQTLDSIIEFFEQMGLSGLKPDDDLVTSGSLSSIEMLELIDFLERSFHIEIDRVTVSPDHFATPRVIAGYVEERKRQ